MNGEQRRENGAYLYRKDRIVDSWKADDLSEYVPRFQRRYERCLDSMEMNSGSSRGKRNLREESLQEMPDFWRIWRRKQKNHHTDLGIIGWKQNAGLSHS